MRALDIDIRYDISHLGVATVQVQNLVSSRVLPAAGVVVSCCGCCCRCHGSDFDSCVHRPKDVHREM